jgi:hypothetical protein
MKTTTSKFAKVFAPALLVTASLALPVKSYAANDGGFAVDGYLNGDRNSNCLVLREHDGGVRYITGAVGGLQPGDHVRLYGYPVSGSACNVRGSAYEVSQVQTLWGDDRHRTTTYDHQRDGAFDNYAYRSNRSYGQDRYGRDNDRYNDRYNDRSNDRYNNRTDSRYDDGRYGRYDDRSSSRDRDLVSLRGRLNDNGRGCPTLQTSDGRVWSLVGDLRGFRDDARAKVIGWTNSGTSQCGGPTLDVREISRY